MNVGSFLPLSGASSQMGSRHVNSQCKVITAILEVPKEPRRKKCPSVGEVREGFTEEAVIELFLLKEVEDNRQRWVTKYCRQREHKQWY